MTHEQILGCSADELEKLTDEQLLEFYKPMLCVTRPELANKDTPDRKRYNQQSLKGYEQSIDFKTKMAAAQAIAQSMGVKLKI